MGRSSRLAIALFAALLTIGLASADSEGRMHPHHTRKPSRTVGASVIPSGGGGGGPTPTLEDNFTSLNTSLWVPVYVAGDPGFGLDSNFLGNLSKVSIVTEGADTFARITATKHAADGFGRTYDSACFGTKGTFAQLYGIFEARIRYPAGQGVWPAFWTLQDGLNVSPPEGDIFEAYPAPAAGGGSEVDVAISALHTTTNPSRFSIYDGPVDLTAQWHVWKLTWRSSLWQVSIDGTDLPSPFPLTSDIPAVAMYPIVNLALGAPGFRVDGTTPTPLTMDIDYIRVYP